MATPQKLRCLVDKITDHGDHVYTVDLKPERLVPRFKPGQFLHLTLDDYDPSGFWPESRVFSIASSAARRDHIKISYSVRGRYTARMENELKEGASVWVKLPYGDFVIKEASDVVLLAGGTGITAFIAFIEGLTTEFHKEVFLFYGVRKQELLLFRDLIDAKAKTNNFLCVTYFIENAKSETIKGTQSLQSCDLLSGCLSLEPIWEYLSNYQKTTFYIAGPPNMIKCITAALLKKGVSPKMIKVDAWE